MLAKTNFDFKTHNRKKKKRKNKLRCPLTVFITSVGSSILLHHKRRTDAGHSKTTVQENWKIKIKTKKFGKGKTPGPANLAYLTALTNKTEIFLKHKPERFEIQTIWCQRESLCSIFGIMTNSVLTVNVYQANFRYPLFFSYVINTEKRSDITTSFMLVLIFVFFCIFAGL